MSQVVGTASGISVLAWRSFWACVFFIVGVVLFLVAGFHGASWEGVNLGWLGGSAIAAGLFVAYVPFR